jgi:hypothetical protein
MAALVDRGANARTVREQASDLRVVFVFFILA